MVKARGNTLIATALVGVIAAMGGLVYYSVPLYALFCQVTGYGGTTRRAAAAPAAASRQRLTVRFNADVNPDLAWRFAPAQRQVTVRIGEQTLAHFRARNLADETLVGTATFNVTPQKAAIYFNKVECFCFTEQLLEPGQEVDLPVSFFIDPDILDDRNAGDVTTVTLSYTFFKKAKPLDGARQVRGAAGAEEG